jgi:hypothetical protein
MEFVIGLVLFGLLGLGAFTGGSDSRDSRDWR